MCGAADAGVIVGAVAVGGATGGAMPGVGVVDTGWPWVTTRGADRPAVLATGRTGRTGGLGADGTDADTMGPSGWPTIGATPVDGLPGGGTGGGGEVRATGVGGVGGAGSGVDGTGAGDGVTGGDAGGPGVEVSVEGSGKGAGAGGAAAGGTAVTGAGAGATFRHCRGRSGALGRPGARAGQRHCGDGCWCWCWWMCWWRHHRGGNRDQNLCGSTGAGRLRVSARRLRSGSCFWKRSGLNPRWSDRAGTERPAVFLVPLRSVRLLSGVVLIHLVVPSHVVSFP